MVSSCTDSSEELAATPGIRVTFLVRLHLDSGVGYIGEQTTLCATWKNRICSGSGNTPCQATLGIWLHLESGYTYYMKSGASSRARLRYNWEQSTPGIKLHPAQDTYGVKLHISLDMWDLTASRFRLHLESGNI